MVIAIAALAGYGFQAWLDRGASVRGRALAARLLPMAAVVLVFVVGPIVVGSSPSTYLFFAVGGAYGLFLLMRIARGDRWPVTVLPILLAIEHRPEVLIVDLDLPGGRGVETVRRVAEASSGEI